MGGECQEPVSLGYHKAIAPTNYCGRPEGLWAGFWVLGGEERFFSGVVPDKFSMFLAYSNKQSHSNSVGQKQNIKVGGTC